MAQASLGDGQAAFFRRQETIISADANAMTKDRTWYNYLPLSTAALPDIRDDGSRVFLKFPVVRLDGRPPLEVAVIGDQERLELIRVKTPETDGNLTAEESRQIASISEHVLSILRLCVSKDIDRLYVAGMPLQFGCFEPREGGVNMAIQVEEQVQRTLFESDQIKQLITGTAAIRVQVSLLSEAAHPVTPLPFKFLCLYKILELELRTGRQWRGLVEHLAKYSDEFKSLSLSPLPLMGFLHSCRDKCAHVKTGGSDELGLIGLGSKDAQLVRPFLPLFGRIVVDLLNEKHGSQVQFAYIEFEPWRHGKVSNTIDI